MQTLQQQQTRAASRPAALAKPALLGMRVALSRPAFGATLGLGVPEQDQSSHGRRAASGRKDDA